MDLVELSIEPIQGEEEALEAWARIYADRAPPEVIERLCIRLALGMIRHPNVRGAIESGPCRDGKPARGLTHQLSLVAERLPYVPLGILVESDPGVAELLVRHPEAVTALIGFDRDIEAEEARWELTPAARTEPAAFLRMMRQIAPLLLERAEIGVNHSESFVRYLHRPDVLVRLRGASSVRSEISCIVADFCRDCGIGSDEFASSYLTRNVMDNILWQVAAEVARRHGSWEPAEEDGLLRVARALSSERAGKPSPEAPEKTVGYAISGLQGLSGERKKALKAVLENYFTSMFAE